MILSRRTLSLWVAGCALIGGIIGWFSEVDVEV